jgi:hypothetical protein
MIENCNFSVPECYIVIEPYFLELLQYPQCYFCGPDTVFIDGMPIEKKRGVTFSPDDIMPKDGVQVLEFPSQN